MGLNWRGQLMVLSIFWQLGIANADNTRIKLEHSYHHRNGHDVIMQTYFKDPFYEIDILIDDTQVLRLHSIPENLLRYVYLKIESKLDGLIADYEENGVYHYFTIEGFHHGLIAKEPVSDSK